MNIVNIYTHNWVKKLKRKYSLRQKELKNQYFGQRITEIIPKA
jgi:hypothetical protein